MSETAMPQPGKKAPAFSLSNESGEKVSLAGLKGKRFVLYFYPKDDTSGCTVEALEFRDAAKDFEKAGVAVFGVSPDNEKSHCKFRDKHGLNFSLLCDTDHAVAEERARAPLGGADVPPSHIGAAGLVAEGQGRYIGGHVRPEARAFAVRKAPHAVICQ